MARQIGLRDHAMVRDSLFEMLYYALAAQGRQKTLVGNDMSLARQAFGRMAPAMQEAHPLFEMPLVGEPSLDVIVGLNKNGSLVAPKGADPAWRGAIEWLHNATSEKAEVVVMAEADASDGQTGQTGLYLIYRERSDLVLPFLQAIGAVGHYDAWEAFRSRLAPDWTTSYVGVFPGREDGLLRVNARPRWRPATPLPEALGRLGVRDSTGVAESYGDAMGRAWGFDIQLDLDASGTHRGTWGLEFYNEEQMYSPEYRGMDPLLMAHMEDLGVADSRWRALEAFPVARYVTVPMAGAAVPCMMSLRVHSTKVKFPEGAQPYGKVYVRGDAIVRDAVHRQSASEEEVEPS